MAKILMVVTGSDIWTLADGTAHPSGYWAEEVAAPYRAFTEAGYDVVVATPGGVEPTMDPASLAPELNDGQENADAIAALLAGVAALKQPVALEDVRLDDYAGVFYPGGHGPMTDLAFDPALGALLAEFHDGGKIVFGSTVELEDEHTGEAVKYQIVGEDEADIKAGRISVSSPIARAASATASMRRVSKAWGSRVWSMIQNERPSSPGQTRPRPRIQRQRPCRSRMRPS